MTSENLRDNQISWSLSVDGASVPLASGVDGSLTNDGGSVKFTQAGTNVLTATVVDELGRTFTYDQTIEVYPILTLDLTATAAVHTDEYIDVTLDSNTSLPVTWKVTPSNDPSTDTAYTGSLTDFGGSIQIDTAGSLRHRGLRTGCHWQNLHFRHEIRQGLSHRGFELYAPGNSLDRLLHPGGPADLRFD